MLKCLPEASRYALIAWYSVKTTAATVLLKAKRSDQAAGDWSTSSELPEAASRPETKNVLSGLSGRKVLAGQAVFRPFGQGAAGDGHEQFLPAEAPHATLAKEINARCQAGNGDHRNGIDEIPPQAAEPSPSAVPPARKNSPTVKWLLIAMLFPSAERRRHRLLAPGVYPEQKPRQEVRRLMRLPSGVSEDEQLPTAVIASVLFSVAVLGVPARWGRAPWGATIHLRGATTLKSNRWTASHKGESAVVPLGCPKARFSITCAMG